MSTGPSGALDLGEGGLDRRLVGDVQAHARDALVCGRLEVAGDDLGALREQRLGDALADAAGGAGDQGHAPLEAVQPHARRVVHSRYPPRLEWFPTLPEEGGGSQAREDSRGGWRAAPLGSDGLHHVGATVADLDRSLAFWEAFLGRARRFKTVLDRPYLGQILGFPGVQIDAAFVDLPGGVILELLDYRLPDRVPHTDDTRHPGNVHLCFRVEDADAAWRHAVACGARPVNPDGPVELDGGPNKGAKVAYLRDPDGISIELFQMPPHLVERRYERLPAATLERLREEAPLAYVPIGPLEHHGPHLPMGVDGFSAHELSLRAARISGGVVLPATLPGDGLPRPARHADVLQRARRALRRGDDPAALQPRLPRRRAAQRPRPDGPASTCSSGSARSRRRRCPGLRTYALHWLELAAATHEGLRGRAPRPGRPRGRGGDLVDAGDPARVRPHGAPARRPRRPAPARRLRRRPARRLGRARHGAPGGRRRAAGRAGLAPGRRRGRRRARRLPALRRPLLARAAAARRPRRATPTARRCSWPTRAPHRGC